MTITHSSTRFVAVVASVAVAASLLLGAFTTPAQAAALTPSQVSAIVSLLQSFGADQATISNVQASLNGQPTSGTGSTGTTGGSCPALTRDLQVGSSGADVKALQMFLNSMSGTMVAASGAGSPGMESMTFGPATKAAVMKFQTMKAITPVSGYVGAKSRAAIAAACGGTTSTGGGTTVTPTGPGLTITASAQPANALAPQGAMRVPFTNFTLTNNTGSAITVNGVTVQRTGFGIDSNFAGIVLIDNNGLQYGTAKTLNSNHQTTIGDTFTIQAGQTLQLSVAGNISSVANVSGQVVALEVVAVNTSAPVNGSLPINGASQTINTNLSIGTISTSTSSFDPGTAQNKNIGDTNVKFSGVRFTANSAEDEKLFNIRWRQVGSASAADLANIVTVVNGTTYPTVMDATGRYYTTVFPGGLTILKGNNVDVYVQGDIIGSNSAGRTVDFDLDKSTDVYFVGQTYGYGASFSPSYTTTPWYNGQVVTIQAGTATTIGKATEVPSQNIAINVPNQVLGGFVADFKGEGVSVNNMVFHLNYSSGAASTYPITSISIVNENGAVVAGPVDAQAVAGTDMTATFTDTVTFPTGRHIYTLKGKVPSGVSNNVTVAASTTPSSWSSPMGQTSGNTVTISQGNFSMNTMTVKTATLSVTLSATPASQTIVAGGQGVTFANVQLDASQSGEDVRISSLPIRLAVATVATTDLSSCQLWNGATAVNTGSNVPSSISTTNTFTLDNSLIVPKGTVTTLTLKCNVSSGAASTGTFVWSLNSSDTIAATGVTSGASVSVANGANNSGTMTVGAASLIVATDPSSPAYALAAAGSNGVTLGVYKFTASNEPITLNRIGLSLGTVSASSSAADLTQVYLYNGSTLLGTATFTGSSRTATSSLTTPVTVPKDGSVVVTVKADLPTQSTSGASHPGALLTIDNDTNGATGNKNTQGTGVNSGTTVGVSSGSTAVAGVRVFKSVPTIAKLTPPTATLIAQSGVELYRFSVTASPATADGIALNKLVVNLATSSASTANGTTTVDNVKVFAYTDSSFSQAVAGYTSGQINATLTPVAAGNNTITATTILTIPAGATYYFKVTGDITQVAGTTGSAGTVTTKLSGDTSYPSLSTLMGQYSSGLGNFVWSPLSTSTTANTANLDWTNGYQIPGLPSGGTDAWTLTK